MNFEELRADLVNKVLAVITKPSWDICKGLMEIGLLEDTSHEAMNELAREIVGAFLSCTDYLLVKKVARMVSDEVRKQKKSEG